MPDPGKSFLLIDDDLAHCSLTERALRRAGYGGSIITHLDGGEALKFLAHPERPKPDLVLLDWKMPGLSGEEVLRRMRAHERVARTPVLIVSGSTFPEDRARADELGADDYLLKPSPGTRDYHDFALEVVAWQPSSKEIVRVSCAPDAVPVRRVDTATNGMNEEQAGSYPGGHLDFAAKIARLPLSIMLDGSIKDHGVWEKRRVFVRALFSLGWTKPEIRLYLKVSVRWLEDEEGKPVSELCCSRAALLK